MQGTRKAAPVWRGPLSLNVYRGRSVVRVVVVVVVLVVAKVVVAVLLVQRLVVVGHVADVRLDRRALRLKPLLGAQICAIGVAALG